MTETSHARGRRAALAGLLVQIVVVIAVYGLAFASSSLAVMHLSFYLAAGIPVWLGTLLVLRQMELAGLEQLDLEQLRREKQTTGGGAAIFGQEGGGGLGFMIAQTRLEWMLRYMLPAFGLASAVIMIGFGTWMLTRLNMRFGFFDLADREWLLLNTPQIPLAMILMSLVCLVTFFFGRYATGMARVNEWQLLRGCGGFMLGNSVATLAVIVGFGANLYRQIETWDRAIAFIIPMLMLVIGVETLLAFVLDLYRPRTPGTVARAAYDSRLLGLLSEPGGIAHSLREAINYQFGFQITHSWFYLLMERAFLPLFWTAAIALWLLTSVIIVEPYERAIVTHWGRQVNAADPLAPGIHFKQPWPIEKVEKFNTDQLYEIEIGFKAGYTHEEDPGKSGQPEVELWTDDKHAGHEHFNFLLPPPPRSENAPTTAAVDVSIDGKSTQAPVNISRMHVAIQFRLRPDRLAEHTGSAGKPEDILKALAWNEVLQMAASTDIDSLMGPERARMSDALKKRLSKRADQAKLGYEIVYVGILGVHPEKTVAEAFRRVVTAQQEKIAEIRKIQVDENRMLTSVAGERTRALVLGNAIAKVYQYDDMLDASNRIMHEAKGVEALTQALNALEPQFTAVVEAEWHRDRAKQVHEDMETEFELGLGRSLRQRQQTQLALDEATAQYETARKTLDAALTRVRSTAPTVSAELQTAAIDNARGRFGHAYWTHRLEQNLIGLEGDAAVVLAVSQASRYEREMRAAGEVTLVLNERRAHDAAPKIYRARRYLEVLITGMRDARKYFLAFDPAGRQVRVTYDAHEVAAPELGTLPAEKPD